MKKEMKKEMRLIDANALLENLGEEPMVWSDSEAEIQERNDWQRFKACVEAQDTVDAVEVEKYNRLVEAYHELRENFIDFVCSGIPNVAPYCLNRCDGCCDAYGWCRQSDLCQGFNPAEVILDGERKDNE